MAKHPVPKRKKTSHKSAVRHSAWKTKNLKRLSNLAKTINCPKCKQPRLPHTACMTCGYYRGRVVIDFAAKDSKKIEKISA